jgi:hypothetical protein
MMSGVWCLGNRDEAGDMRGNWVAIWNGQERRCQSQEEAYAALREMKEMKK